ncbi:hypothetical protein D1632_05525 [Chryseobacterium nematophagum]|uniref:Uncharacterized protein n=1 Tax=Chryseobacterium nematophagum TaxID=2305228 RepID=A0A3M7LCA2_9FLAO|nr:hypothetical protein [Chryseobacterium nematophagum]RMZ60398.1 hypothetical protein D1632_05525 [Chryseobacterium nematophagum]
MKNEIHKHLKFRIGEESCKHEFRLFYKEEYCCKKYCYEVYEFDKVDHEHLFDLKVEKIMLYYNADVLTKIDYYFKPYLHTKLKVLIEQFIGVAYEQKLINNTYYCSWYIGKYYLILRKPEKEKRIVLSYQKRKTL